MSDPSRQWMIYFGRGIKLIGRMVPHTRDEIKANPVLARIVQLQPCYELVDMKLPAQQGILNMVSVQPIAGLCDPPLVRIDSNDPSPTIMVEELSDGDQRMMMARVQECIEHCDQLRAKRSGIEIVGADQLPKGERA